MRPANPLLRKTFPTPPGPDEIVVEWRGFIEEIRTLPVRVFFGQKSEVLEASTVLPKISWKAQGRLPLPTPLAQVPQISVESPLMVPLASIIYAFVRFKGSKWLHLSQVLNVGFMWQTWFAGAMAITRRW